MFFDKNNFLFEFNKLCTGIAKAANTLMQVKKNIPILVADQENPFAVVNVDHKFEVIGSTNSLTEALKELLSAAQEAQSQRADWSRTADKSVYHRDETWVDGLISAANQVS